MGFVEQSSKKPEHSLPADYPMAIWNGFVDYYVIILKFIALRVEARGDGPLVL